MEKVGPLLFLLFVNDLQKWIVSSLKMFADDTRPKPWISLKSKTDSAILQNDLDNLIAWSNQWLLKFNPSKCKLVHIPYEYHMVDDIGRSVMIEETSLEKDFCIYRVAQKVSHYQMIKNRINRIKACQ